VKRAIVLLSVLAAATGCGATAVASTAPAVDPGWRYVAGQRSGQPAVWICPDTPGQGECKQVDVEEETR